MASIELTFIVHEAPDHNFIAEAVGHEIRVEASSMDELKEQIQDAVIGQFPKKDRPTTIRLHITQRHNG